MGRKRFTPEQIITMLREAEVLPSQGAQSLLSSASWGSLNSLITVGGRNITASGRAVP